MSEYWISIQEDSLRIRKWDDEYVLYHVLTGDTHMLDAMSYSVLSFLKNRAANCEEILEYLRDTKSYDLQADQLQELLESLLRNYLIKNVS